MDEGLGYQTMTLSVPNSEDVITVLFSNQDAEEIRKHKWMYKDGYAHNSETGSMHRFVFRLRGIDIPDDMTIDHINRVRHDNRFENLRPLPPSEQALNGSKRHHAQSDYHGVSPSRGTWSVNGSYQGKRVHIGSRMDELEAAKLFDRWTVNLPDFDPTIRPVNFPELIDHHKMLGPPEPRVLKRKYRGVKLTTHNTFEVRAQGVYYGHYKDQEAAARARDDIIVSKNIDSPLNFPERYPDYGKPVVKTLLSKAENGVAYVWIEKRGEYLLLDVDDYEKCKYYHVNVNQHGYVTVRVDKLMLLARFLLSMINRRMCVIYKNSNKMDCRRANLEIVHISETARHQPKKEGTASVFHGVSINGKYWLAELYVPKHLVTRLGGKKQFAKHTKSPEVAARWRDLHIMHYYPGSTYQLNFKWTPEDKLYWMQTLKIEFKE